MDSGYFVSVSIDAISRGTLLTLLYRLYEMMAGLPPFYDGQSRPVYPPLSIGTYQLTCSELQRTQIRCTRKSSRTLSRSRTFSPPTREVSLKVCLLATLLSDWERRERTKLRNIRSLLRSAYLWGSLVLISWLASTASGLQEVIGETDQTAF